MTTETCILTTKDFTILEVMRDRCLGRDDPLAPILEQEDRSATVMFSATTFPRTSRRSAAA